MDMPEFFFSGVELPTMLKLVWSVSNFTLRRPLSPLRTLTLKLASRAGSVVLPMISPLTLRLA